MKWIRKDILIAFIHAAAMILVIVLPALGSRLSNAEPHEIWHLIYDGVEEYVPIFTIYLLNYYWIIPKYYNTRKAPFFILNALLILFFTIGIDLIFGGQFWKHDHFYAPRFYFFLVMDILMYILTVACALAVHSIKRLQVIEVQLKEVQQQKAEAELVWLKNQLNPHFLFNTLNNISSLVQIDADTAQENISKLSDLLRYALYESNKPRVPLHNELSFMENYISLMKLRTNEKVNVDIQLDTPQQDVEIVPLLFITILENAFKHGVSHHQSSFIKARLKVSDGYILFTCDNSNFPKHQEQTGRGVGLENMRRRLELFYPDRHEYVHTLENNIYHVSIKIKA